MKRSARKLTFSLAAAMACSFPLAASADPCPQHVTGYYAGYLGFSPDYQAPQHVDFTQMTHFIYARAVPGGGSRGGPAGTVQPGDKVADADRRVGIGAPTRSIQEYLVARAHQVGTKALLMLGGDNELLGFRASLAPEVRATFIDNLLSHLSSYAYDGVDIDMEGALDDGDEQLLRAFVTELRTAAAAHPRYAGPGLLITFPGVTKNTNTDPTVSEHDVWMATHVDQYNIMSYGAGTYANGWASTLHSPLTGHVTDRPIDIASTIQEFVNGGVSRCNIGMGIGFYGMMYTAPFIRPGQLPSEVYPDEVVPDWSHWSTSDAQWNYTKLFQRGYLDHGTYIWDTASQTGYRTYGIEGYQYAGDPTSPNVGYLSFEDEAGIAAKGAWSRSADADKGAAGTIVWVVNFGTTDGINNPLMLAVNRAFLDPDAVDQGPSPNPGPLPDLPPDAPTDPPPPPPPPPVPSQLLSYSLAVQNDWGTGYCADIDITYDSAGTVDGSFVLASIPIADAIDNMWNGTYTREGSTITVSSPVDNPVIHPGETRVVGFCAQRASAPPPPPPTGAPPDLSTSHIELGSTWGTGNWCATVHVINTGGTAAHLWTVTLPLPQGTSPILQFYGDGGVTWSQDGSNLTIASTVNWNDIAPDNKKDIGICHM